MRKMMSILALCQGSRLRGIKGMTRSRTLVIVTLAVALAVALTLASSSISFASANSKVPPAMHIMKVKNACRHCGGSANLSYHGGANGVGVETGSDKVYLI